MRESDLPWRARPANTVSVRLSQMELDLARALADARCRAPVALGYDGTVSDHPTWPLNYDSARAEVGVAQHCGFEYPAVEDSERRDRLRIGDDGTDFREWYRDRLESITIQVKATIQREVHEFQIMRCHWPLTADVLIQCMVHRKVESLVWIVGWASTEDIRKVITGPRSPDWAPDYSPQYWYPASVLRPIGDLTAILRRSDGLP